MSARGTARRRDSRRGEATKTAEAHASSGPDGTSALSVVFPGTPSSAPAARGFLRGVLAASPRLDDLELIVSELVTNAVRHTPSGQPGGSLTLTVEHAPRRARIEVGDLGTERWQPLPGDPSAEYGRGLLLVMALADGIGHDAIPGNRHRSWAEVTW